MIIACPIENIICECNDICDGGALNILSFIQFSIFRWYFANRALFIVLIVSGLACLIIAGALAGIHRQHAELTRMRDEFPRSGVRAATTHVAIELPSFSTANVVETLNGIADDMHVPLDEVVYVLDSPASMPYDRYRVTLSVKAAYPEVRKFIAVVASDMPNVALDSIRCARPDAGAPMLGCELSFSAFFTKSAHG